MANHRIGECKVNPDQGIARRFAKLRTKRSYPEPYYLSLKGKGTEKSMAIENFLDEQAARDLEEFRATSFLRGQFDS